MFMYLLSQLVILLRQWIIPDINSATITTGLQQVVNVMAVSTTGKNTVPENYVKEVMPCEVSSLGFHLLLSLKEKIQKEDFVDLLSLLPSAKDFSFRHDKKCEDKQEDCTFIPRSFLNWLQAYCIFSSILAEKKPELCVELFQHLEQVLEAYRNFGGMGWFQYDESFRHKLPIYPTLKWGMKDVGLWLNLIVP